MNIVLKIEQNPFHPPVLKFRHKGLLPEDAIVAHKTGHSGKNKKGLTGALNDIGIIFFADMRSLNKKNGLTY